VLLLSAGTGLAFETDYSLAERDPALDPPAYVRLEILRVGLGCQGWSEPTSFLGGRADARVLHLGVEVHRFRAGITLMDFTSSTYDACLLPVTLGYTLYEQPVRITGSMYGKRRELYVEATARWDFLFLHTTYPPDALYAGTLELVGSADYLAGASAAVGLEYARVGGYPIGEPDYSELRPFIGLRLQLPVLRVGF
jgi:hypothetical protein